MQAVHKVEYHPSGKRDSCNGVALVCPCLPWMAPVCDCCRGQVGKHVIKHLSVEYVRDLAAYQAKELTDMFGMATGNLACPCLLLQ